MKAQKNIKREIIHINIFCFILYAYKIYACPLYDCIYFLVTKKMCDESESMVGVTRTEFLTFLYLFACLYLEYPLLTYFSLLYASNSCYSNFGARKNGEQVHTITTSYNG